MIHSSSIFIFVSYADDADLQQFAANDLLPPSHVPLCENCSCESNMVQCCMWTVLENEGLYPISDFQTSELGVWAGVGGVVMLFPKDCQSSKVPKFQFFCTALSMSEFLSLTLVFKITNRSHVAQLPCRQQLILYHCSVMIASCLVGTG